MFDRFFNGENPFWKEMGRVYDAFVLNLLWMLCCLPVFTVGPATIAFYYAMIALVREEEGYVSKDFFRSFKRNFKQGVWVGLLLMAVGGFLALDIVIARRSGTGIFTFFMVFFFILLVFWSFVTLYTFPILAKFEKSTRDALIWAFALSVQNLPKTLLMLLVLALGLWACHLLPGLVFIVFGLECLFQSRRFAAIFRPWLPEPGAVEEDEPAGDGGEDGV